MKAAKKRVETAGPVRHTPGPWEWLHDADGHAVRMGDAVDSPGRHESHNVWKCEHCIYPEESAAQRRQFQQAEANARLIAAAPDLLEALKMLADMSRWRCRCTTAEIESGHHVDCWKPEADVAGEAARAAIAKAEGA
jgi:hypothetical protein